jgi:hypothetical protein
MTFSNSIWTALSIFWNDIYIVRFEVVAELERQKWQSDAIKKQNTKYIINPSEGIGKKCRIEPFSICHFEMFHSQKSSNLKIQQQQQQQQKQSHVTFGKCWLERKSWTRARSGTPSE